MLGKYQPRKDLPDVEIANYGAIFIVPSTCEHQEVLFKTFCFGKFTKNMLVLTPYEVFFINLIQQKENLSELWQTCSKMCKPGMFASRYAVYHYYRCNLWVVRDGSTFGGDFVLYRDHPDQVHSDYIVIVLDSWENRDQTTIIASRVAWSVKKQTLFIRVVIPDGCDLDNHECIQSFVLEDVVMKRVKFA